MPTTITIEVTYANGDMLRKTIPSTDVISASNPSNMFTDMDTYIDRFYPDAQNYFFYYEGSMLYSKTHRDSLQALFTAISE